MPRRLPGVSAHPAKISSRPGSAGGTGACSACASSTGRTLQKSKVKEYAVQWSKYGNIRFDFTAGAKAEIRVSFEADPGSSWSAIGTDCLDRRYFPKSDPP